MTERERHCKFETDKIFCEISEEGQKCRQFDVCDTANTQNGNDLTVFEFCQMNPSWAINQALALRKNHLETSPDSKTPFRNIHTRLTKLPPVYIYELREKISSNNR